MESDNLSLQSIQQQQQSKKKKQREKELTIHYMCSQFSRDVTRAATQKLTEKVLSHKHSERGAHISLLAALLNVLQLPFSLFTFQK